MIWLCILIPNASAFAIQRDDALRKYLQSAAKEGGVEYMKVSGFHVRGAVQRIDVNDVVEFEAANKMPPYINAVITLTFSINFTNPHLRWDPSAYNNQTEIEMPSDDLFGPSILHGGSERTMCSGTPCSSKVAFTGNVNAEIVTYHTLSFSSCKQHGNVPHDSFDCETMLQIDGIEGFDLTVNNQTIVAGTRAWDGSDKVRSENSYSYLRRSGPMPVVRRKVIVFFTIFRNLSYYYTTQFRNQCAKLLAVLVGVVVIYNVTKKIISLWKNEERKEYAEQRLLWVVKEE